VLGISIEQFEKLSVFRRLLYKCHTSGLVDVAFGAQREYAFKMYSYDSEKNVNTRRYATVVTISSVTWKARVSKRNVANVR